MARLIQIFQRTLVVITFSTIIYFVLGCQTDNYIKKAEQNLESFPFAFVGINELKKGDIIVKPNSNILPGSSFVTNGKGFGHAALVISDFQHENIDSLLAGVEIIESIAKDVPVEFQVRRIKGLVINKSDAFNNTNFDKHFQGNLYRLRLELTEQQIDSIIAFALDQRNNRSAWNASKSFPDEENYPDKIRKNWADNNTWYCSLLVWQSIYYVTRNDTDPNGAYMVYPNDLINSKLFDNSSLHRGRVRF